MSVVASQFGWLVLIVGGITGLSLFPRWAARYYHEPTLLDAHDADCFCMQAGRDEDAQPVDDLALLHPMPKRPGPPTDSAKR